MAATGIFHEAVDKISRAYEDLGHELGWRFLASPARTLSEDTKMLFAGINPGGSRYEPPLASVEGGNAYRVERWGKDGGSAAYRSKSTCYTRP